MKLDDLKLSYIYYLAGIGNVIYCGITEDDNLLKFRRIENPKYTTYLDKQYANTVRMPLDKPKKLQAVELHNQMYLHVSDIMFFQNNNGILYGTIKKLFGNSCELKVRNITKEVHLKHLFTYEATFGDMQTRAGIVAIMQGKNAPDTKREVPEQATH